jgi:hypothetical protein
METSLAVAARHFERRVNAAGLALVVGIISI